MARSGAFRFGTTLGLCALLLSVPGARCQAPPRDWQAEVRKLAEAQDWTQAMALIEAEEKNQPGDIEIREWRARVLTWSGKAAEAEREWNQVVRIAPKDPDNWLGLASVYQREGKWDEAQRAIDAALELDPRRADLQAARGRILRAGNNRSQAKLAFEEALRLDPSSEEARAGLDSLRAEPQHVLRLGQDNDTFNFAGANHDEWADVASRWTPHWATDLGTNFYERGGTTAGKFIGSLTGRSSRWGALTVGGATSHDNEVIPRSEAFFGINHGFALGESGWVRAVEAAYGQHWYWYRDARILALSQTVTLDLPREWTWMMRVTEARSHFSNTGAEWKPSGLGKLNFPLARGRGSSLSGGVFFAAGTENFAQVDQIGSFASQSYGGELKWRFSARQDVTAYSFYQKRTQQRTQTSFGLSYGIRF